MTAGVFHHRLLTVEECHRVLAGSEANRAAWTNRYPGLPAYTLGAASYLDSGPAAGQRAAYHARAKALNPLLEREFGWLYERLLKALREHLRAEVSFAPDAARPGFHIFLADPAFKRPLGRIHFDLQFEGIDWPEDGMDFSRPVSYTLAIRLPKAGAGLQTWDIGKAEFDALSPEARRRIGDDETSGYVPYREGFMVCHSGMLLHRIAPAGSDLRADDMRVTLQGHALPGPNGYRLYW